MSSTVTTTTVQSSRAGTIEDILDENVLREMWMEATESESKRQIRSRMYKLREERLKNYYNREDILENILKSDTGAGPDDPPPSTTSTTITKTRLIRESGAYLEEEPLDLDSDFDLRAQIRSKDRTRQLSDIRTGKALKVISESEPEAEAPSPRSTPTRPLLSNPKRNGQAQNQNTKSGTGKKSSLSLTTTRASSKTSTFSSHSQQSETKVTATKSSTTTMSSPPSKKVTKGMLSPPSTHKAITPTSSRPSSPEKPLPRFMSSTKSRDIQIGAAGVHPRSPKKGPSPVRSLSPAEPKGKVIKSPELTLKVAVNGSHKEKTPTSTREGSLSPLRRPPQKAAASEVKGQGPKVAQPPRKGTQVTSASSPKNKSRAEESIIRELDNLDSFLQLTDDAGAGKGAGLKMSEAPAKKKGPVPLKKDKELVDVMESGLEPVVVKTIYKYGCTEPDKNGLEDQVLVEPGTRAREPSVSPPRKSLSSRTGASQQSSSTDESLKSFSAAQRKKGVLTESRGGILFEISRARTPRNQEVILSRPVNLHNTRRIPSPEARKAAAEERKKPKPKDLDAGWGHPNPVAHKTVKKAGVNYEEGSEGEEEDPRVPQKRLGQTKGLESPGAVLLAKSLFENKATEAAMDKSSGGFSQGGSSFKVTKKTALFEARARGERLSISSESSLATNDHKEATDDTPAGEESAHGTQTVPKLFLTSESTEDSNSNIKGKNEYETAVDHPDPRPADSSPKGPKKGRSRSNSVLLDAKVEALVNRSNKTAHGSGERRPEAPDLSAIDDVEALNRLLDTASDYESRMAIRSRIRLLTRARERQSRSDPVPASAPATKKTSLTPKSEPEPGKQYGSRKSSREIQKAAQEAKKPALDKQDSIEGLLQDIERDKKFGDRDVFPERTKAAPTKKSVRAVAQKFEGGGPKEELPANIAPGPARGSIRNKLSTFQRNSSEENAFVQQEKVKVTNEPVESVPKFVRKASRDKDSQSPDRLPFTETFKRTDDVYQEPITEDLPKFVRKSSRDKESPSPEHKDRVPITEVFKRSDDVQQKTISEDLPKFTRKSSRDRKSPSPEHKTRVPITEHFKRSDDVHQKTISEDLPKFTRKSSRDRKSPSPEHKARVPITEVFKRSDDVHQKTVSEDLPKFTRKSSRDRKSPSPEHKARVPVTEAVKRSDDVHQKTISEDLPKFTRKSSRDRKSPSPEHKARVPITEVFKRSDDVHQKTISEDLPKFVRKSSRDRKSPSPEHKARVPVTEVFKRSDDVHQKTISEDLPKFTRKSSRDRKSPSPEHKALIPMTEVFKRSDDIHQKTISEDLPKFVRKSSRDKESPSPDHKTRIPVTEVFKRSDDVHQKISEDFPKFTRKSSRDRKSPSPEHKARVPVTEVFKRSDDVHQKTISEDLPKFVRKSSRDRKSPSPEPKTLSPVTDIFKRIEEAGHKPELGMSKDRDIAEEEKMNSSRSSGLYSTRKSSRELAVASEVEQQQRPTSPQGAVSRRSPSPTKIPESSAKKTIQVRRSSSPLHLPKSQESVEQETKKKAVKSRSSSSRELTTKLEEADRSNVEVRKYKTRKDSHEDLKTTDKSSKEEVRKYKTRKDSTEELKSSTVTKKVEEVKSSEKCSKEEVRKYKARKNSTEDVKSGVADSPEPTPKRHQYPRKTSSKELKPAGEEPLKKTVPHTGSKTTVSITTKKTTTTTLAPALTESEAIRRRDQEMEAITSSYGVGPIDDNGTPLFGLRALKRIKQVKEQMQYAEFCKEEEAVSSDKADVESERRSSIRDSDNYGLRALRKNSGAGSTSFPDGLDRKSEPHPPANQEDRPPVSTSPKSILKKTSSFSSNQSGSKTEVDPFRPEEKQSLAPTTSARTELTTSMPHLSQDSAEGSGSRARGGSRSSVREMSQKFEGSPGSGSEVRATRTTRTTTSGGHYDQVIEGHGVVRGSGRSFLNDRTQVTGVADIMDRMRWRPDEAAGQDEGCSLLNKFLGAQVLMQGIEPMLQNQGTAVTSTMSRSLVIRGIDIDQELDCGKLQELLDEVELEDEKGRIEARLKSLGAASISVSKKSSRSADMTGELMPFILGQLQSSLESALGGSSGDGALAKSTGQGSCSIPPLEAPAVGSPATSSPASSTKGNRNGSPSGRPPLPGAPVPEDGSAEECLFDSGTESGEDGPAPPTPPKPSPPLEFSSFMEGLRTSMTRDGLDLLSSLTAQPAPQQSAAPPDLVTQVDSVLSLLKDSLLKDPAALLAGTGPGKSKELIALIDRLKASLEVKGPVPATVGPPDVLPKNPWALRLQAPPTERRDSEPASFEEVPWKIRAAKKRSQVRSRSIGDISDEELAEARRFLEEEAFRKQSQRKALPPATAKNSVPRPYVRSESARDEPALGSRLKPFRTFSLDSPHDPSQSFFTPEEVVQISIHKAAIAKQVSEEEDRRRRRNSLSAPPLPDLPAPLTPRDFSLAMPKPYAAPGPYLPSGSLSSSDESRQTVRRRSSSSSGGDQVLLYPGTGSGPAPSPQRIENVQISLKDLSSSADFPQNLLIAITLNTNSSSGNSNGPGKGEGSEVKSGSSEDTEPSTSSKGSRYKSKSERKKRMKRANTIDLPAPPLEPEGDDEEDGESDLAQALSPSSPFPVKNESDRKFLAFLGRNRGGEGLPSRPAYLNVNDDRFWNSRFSNLKTSFESSTSQGSSPSLSPVPIQHVKARIEIPIGVGPRQEAASKPIWAMGTKEGPAGPGTMLSSVRNKLSVFEGKGQGQGNEQQVRPKATEVWKTAAASAGNDYVNQAPAQAQRSSILSKKESFEKKFLEEGPREGPKGVPVPHKPKPIQAKAFEPPPPPLPPKKAPAPIYEGVHMVHATKSALEAMNRPSFPHLPAPAQTVPLRPPFTPKPLPQASEPPPWAKPAPELRPLSSGVQMSKALFESKKVACSSPPVPPHQPAPKFGPASDSTIAGKRSDFENFQRFRGHPPMEDAGVTRHVGVVAPMYVKPRLGAGRSFDDAFKQKLESTAPRIHLGPHPLAGGGSAFVRQVSTSAPSLTPLEVEDDEFPSPPTLNSPVLSKVMRGPMQQRATVTRRELSSLGEDHPSAERIRQAVGPIPAPRALQLPAQGLVKSSSGESLLLLPAPRPPPPIPRQKSLSEFPREFMAAPAPKPIQPLAPPAPKPIPPPAAPAPKPNPPPAPKPVPPPAAYPKGPFVPQQDALQRTSSGSSIFDRAKSLFICTQEAGGARPVPPLQPRKKPTALPRSAALFPKQYEAQMSPESVANKTRAVESYFKFPEKEPEVPVRARYARAARKGDHQQAKIRKSASQGKIMSRRRSYSDEDEDVDSIFESLFKASVESKSARSTAAGEVTSAEKLVASQKESKAVEKSASVKSSSTGTGSSVSVQKSTKTSSSFSSSSTAASSSTTVSSAGSPFSKFKELDHQNSVGKADGAGKAIFKFTNPAVKASANSAKDMLLYWAQCRTRDYQNVKLENFSSSWSDGLAFCALIHNFFPTAFDFNSLNPKNRKFNFDLAFKTADEKAGIYPLLDTEDMLAMGRRPDWKCVFTYVQSMYQKLKDL